MRQLALCVMLGCCAWARAEPISTASPGPYEAADHIFADFCLDAHIPGLVYGVVADGQLAHVGTFGVQDLSSGRPVTADTLFRIASMTKAFTALTVLKLRDNGRLRLDALAEEYVPEMRGWKYPTEDSPRIRVRDEQAVVDVGDGEPPGQKRVAPDVWQPNVLTRISAAIHRAPAMDIDDHRRRHF